VILCRTDRGGLERMRIELPEAAAPLTTPYKALSIVGMSRPVLTKEVVGDRRDADDSARVSDHCLFGPMIDVRQATAAGEIRVEKPYYPRMPDDRHCAARQQSDAESFFCRQTLICAPTAPLPEIHCPGDTELVTGNPECMVRRFIANET